jgi:hypothetical protein
MPGTSDPTWPQYMSAEVPSKVPAALWATRAQDSVSPFDFRRSCCRVQPSAHSQRSRTGQTDWQSSAADEQVDSRVEPHIARAVSTEIHVWSAVVDGNGTKTKWQLIHCKLACFFLILRERVFLWHRHPVCRCMCSLWTSESVGQLWNFVWMLCHWKSPQPRCMNCWVGKGTFFN